MTSAMGNPSTSSGTTIEHRIKRDHYDIAWKRDLVLATVGDSKVDG